MTKILQFNKIKITIKIKVLKSKTAETLASEVCWQQNHGVNIYFIVQRTVIYSLKIYFLNIRYEYHFGFYFVIFLHFQYV